MPVVRELLVEWGFSFDKKALAVLKSSLKLVKTLTGEIQSDLNGMASGLTKVGKAAESAIRGISKATQAAAKSAGTGFTMGAGGPAAYQGTRRSRYNAMQLGYNPAADREFNRQQNERSNRTYYQTGVGRNPPRGGRNPPRGGVPRAFGSGWQYGRQGAGPDQTEGLKTYYSNVGPRGLLGSAGSQAGNYSWEAMGEKDLNMGGGKPRRPGRTPSAGGGSEGIYKLYAMGGMIQNVLSPVEGTLRGIASGFQSVVGIAGQYQNSMIAFQAAMGSDAAANKVLGEIETLAAQTQFTIPELENATLLLRNMTNQTEGLVDTVEMLGNVASGTKGNLEKITVAYAKIQSTGRADLISTNSLQRNRVPILKQLAELKGVSIDTIRSMIHDHLIGAKDVEAAFQRMTAAGMPFHDLMKKQAKTIPGYISNITDAFTNIVREATRNDGLMKFTDLLDTMLTYLNENKVMLGQELAGVLKAVTVVARGLWQVIQWLANSFIWLKENVGISDGMFATFLITLIAFTAALKVMQAAILAMEFITLIKEIKALGATTTILKGIAAAFGLVTWEVMLLVVAIGLLVAYKHEIASVLSKIGNALPSNTPQAYVSQSNMQAMYGGGKGGTTWNGDAKVTVNAAGMSPEQAMKATQDGIYNAITKHVGQQNNLIGLGGAY